jgi:hypothetical protein
MRKGILAGPFGDPFRTEGGVNQGFAQIPRGISIARTVYSIVNQSKGRPLVEAAEDSETTQRKLLAAPEGEDQGDNKEDNKADDKAEGATSEPAQPAEVSKPTSEDSEKSPELTNESIAWFAVDTPVTSVYVPFFAAVPGGDSVHDAVPSEISEPTVKDLHEAEEKAKKKIEETEKEEKDKAEETEEKEMAGSVAELKKEKRAAVVEAKTNETRGEHEELKAEKSAEHRERRIESEEGKKEKAGEKTAKREEREVEKDEKKAEKALKSGEYKNFHEYYRNGVNWQFSRDSAWWAFDFVMNFSRLNFNRMSQADIWPLRGEIQAAIDREIEENDFQGKLGEIAKMQKAIEEGGDDTLNPGQRHRLMHHYKNRIGHLKNEIGRWQKDRQGEVVKRWWRLADDLVVKYNDGYLNDVDYELQEGRVHHGEHHASDNSSEHGGEHNSSTDKKAGFIVNTNSNPQGVSGDFIVNKRRLSAPTSHFHDPFASPHHPQKILKSKKIGQTYGYPRAFAEMIGFDNDVHPIYVEPKIAGKGFEHGSSYPLPTVWSGGSCEWVFAEMGKGMVTELLLGADIIMKGEI